VNAWLQPEIVIGNMSSKPFDGPFKIISLYNDGADVKNTSKPRRKVIKVVLNRIQKCPKEIQCSKTS